MIEVRVGTKSKMKVGDRHIEEVKVGLDREARANDHAIEEVHIPLQTLLTFFRGKADPRIRGDASSWHQCPI